MRTATRREGFPADQRKMHARAPTGKMLRRAHSNFTCAPDFRHGCALDAPALAGATRGARLCRGGSAASIFRPMIPADLLLHAYRSGAFPMAVPSGELAWFSPDPRAIVPLDGRFHIPHGLQRTLKRNLFEVRINTAFEDVMRGCAEREDTWISGEIFASYVNLHRLGHAHSVEAWREGRLAGGLYGVAIGGAFFGESMFHRETDASKVALVGLVTRLRERGFTLLDTQWSTPHLRTFGTMEIPRAKYVRLLKSADALECRFV
jgi:leucyl/phenylalanyl-tRNA--protein transferase